jgi:hypothetical protein
VPDEWNDYDAIIGDHTHLDYIKWMKVFKYGKFPLGLFSPITIYTHEPIEINSMPFDELFELTQNKVKSKIRV